MIMYEYILIQDNSIYIVTHLPTYYTHNKNIMYVVSMTISIYDPSNRLMGITLVAAATDKKIYILPT